MAASPIFVNSFFAAYAAEIFIEIKLKVIAIKKNPKESGINEPLLLCLNQLPTAINQHTH